MVTDVTATSETTGADAPSNRLAQSLHRVILIEHAAPWIASHQPEKVAGLGAGAG